MKRTKCYIVAITTAFIGVVFLLIPTASMTKGAFSQGAFYLFAEYTPYTPSTSSQGGLERTSTLEAQLFENAFLPLNLPSQAPSRHQIMRYTVRTGDTVGSIAQNFNVTNNTIQWANNLSATAVLRVGTELTILPTDGVLHKVSTGETLSLLSLMYRVYTEDVIEANDLGGDGFIVAGQTIIIPGASAPLLQQRSLSSERILVDVRGALVNPVPGSRRSQGLHWRNAVDLAKSCGSPVVASAAGTVQKADGVGWNGGFGKYIMLAHSGGFVTAYGHLSQIFVTPGQQVAQGQRIGAVGATGRSTGCHVHFEVRGAINPFAG